MMRNRLNLLVVLAFSVSVFAQKKELKVAEKSFKNKDYTAVLEQLKVVEPLLEGAKEKYKQSYYYLKANSTFGDGKNSESFEDAANAYNELIAFEEEIGSTKYIKDAELGFNSAVKGIKSSGNDMYNAKDYSGASAKFEMVYNLINKDTTSLDNSALSAFYAKEYDRAITLYQQLLELGYTGISKQFRAKSTVNGEYLYYASQEQMNSQVILKAATEPEVVMTEPRTGDIVKNIALSYIAKGDEQGALKAISEAKKLFPKDYTLIISEANIYYKLGDNEKFLSGLKEAISVRPNDPLLYYNVGVLTLEQGYNEEAILAFKKAIELKPDYADAYNNIGVAVLERTKPIIEEMNKNLSNFKKYDALLVEQKSVYKEALPYFEKTHELNPNSTATLSTLVGLYELLEMYDKQKEAKAKIDALTQ